MVALLYRDFEIRKTDPVPPIPTWQSFAWTYCHIDYDGPEDSRIGCCASPEACKAEIDEWHEDIAASGAGELDVRSALVRGAVL